MLAAARRFAGLALDRAVAETNLDRDFVPVRSAERRDRRVVHHLDALRQGSPRRIGDAVRREFVDENVTFDKKSGNAEGQIELGRGQTFGFVRPPGMIDGDL